MSDTNFTNSTDFKANMMCGQAFVLRGSGKPPGASPICPCMYCTTDLGNDRSSARSSTVFAVNLFWTMNCARSPTTFDDGVTWKKQHTHTPSRTVPDHQLPLTMVSPEWNSTHTHHHELCQITNYLWWWCHLNETAHTHHHELCQITNYLWWWCHLNETAHTHHETLSVFATDPFTTDPDSRSI